MYFKSIFSKKKYLKAISKVHVNFNQLQVKFNMQSLKNMVFANFTKNYVQLMEK